MSRTARYATLSATLLMFSAGPAGAADTAPPHAGKVVVSSSSKRFAEAARAMPVSPGSPCFMSAGPLDDLLKTQAPEGRRIVTEAGAPRPADHERPDAISLECAKDSRALWARAKIAANDRTWDEGLQAYARQDYAAALALFKRGYDKIGHANHGYMVGVMLLNGQGAPRDPAAAIAWFTKVAEANPYPTDIAVFHPDAQDISTSKVDALVALAALHLQGKVAPLDAAKSRAYLARAAALGHVVSQVALARMLERGEGGAVDEAGARRLYAQAAQAGYAPAQYELARHHAAAGEAAKALEWFGQAAANVDRSRQAAAQYELARMHDEGVGTPRNAARALALYRLAAEAGHAHALAALANFYYFGEMVEKNHATARQVYQLAAERGSLEAMNALGAMLYRGEGGTADPVAAYRWLRKAERGGVEQAAAAVKAVYASLTPSQISEIDSSQ